MPYFRSMLKNVLSFEGSSALSETAEVGGGVEMDGMEVVELVADGVGDAWSMVELEEAYAILGQVEESDRKRMQVDFLVTKSRQRLEENCRVKDSHFRPDTSI
jgi:hypothetical protein